MPQTALPAGNVVNQEAPLPRVPDKLTADAVAEGVNRVVKKWLLIALAVYLPIWFVGFVAQGAADAERQARVAAAFSAADAAASASDQPPRRTMSDTELDALTEKSRREIDALLKRTRTR